MIASVFERPTTRVHEIGARGSDATLPRRCMVGDPLPSTHASVYPLMTEENRMKRSVSASMPCFLSWRVVENAPNWSVRSRDQLRNVDVHDAPEHKDNEFQRSYVRFTQVLRETMGLSLSETEKLCLVQKTVTLLPWTT